MASDHPIVVPERRPPTAGEARAMAHPLRQRVLRLLGTEELTNRQLADRFEADPATMLYHVRILADAGLIEQLPARSGARGAREKPYRSTGRSWWLSDPLEGVAPDLQFGPAQLALTDALAAGPDGMSTFAMFALHLSDDEVAELDRRLLEVIDEYVATDDRRRDRPVHRGVVVLHRVTPGGAAQE
ncbi:winged helix-turn-helix domain-containing protein [Antribacter gilvus]|uniref:winged helix-turn-helix domain-containing protein n=1 Tax=Antribacter gilvus TaxID=2304675 RepID=UPI000F79AB8A|nr:helix-turn-helix domain-containing protein [Antribacter gilvus]